jgi:hypothetical protein
MKRIGLGRNYDSLKQLMIEFWKRMSTSSSFKARFQWGGRRKCRYVTHLEYVPRSPMSIISGFLEADRRADDMRMDRTAGAEALNRLFLTP